MFANQHPTKLEPRWDEFGEKAAAAGHDWGRGGGPGAGDQRPHRAHPRGGLPHRAATRTTSSPASSPPTAASPATSGKEYKTALGYQPTLEESVDQQIMAIGSVDDVVDTIGMWRDLLGLEHLCCFFDLPGPDPRAARRAAAPLRRRGGAPPRVASTPCATARARATPWRVTVTTILRNARLADGRLVDMTVDDGRITTVHTAVTGARPTGPAVASAAAVATGRSPSSTWAPSWCCRPWPSPTPTSTRPSPPTGCPTPPATSTAPSRPWARCAGRWSRRRHRGAGRAGRPHAGGQRHDRHPHPRRT